MRSSLSLPYIRLASLTFDTAEGWNSPESLRPPNANMGREKSSRWRKALMLQIVHVNIYNLVIRNRVWTDLSLFIALIT
jgi:hypothetical protein